MYVIIAGGGKVGANLARTLLNAGHEVTLVEQRRDRYAVLEGEFEHNVHNGDATEIFVLERAGLISVMRNGHAEIAVGSTELQPGDQVLAILEPGKEDELKRVLLKK